MFNIELQIKKACQSRIHSEKIPFAAGKMWGLRKEATDAFTVCLQIPAATGMPIQSQTYTILRIFSTAM